MIKVTHKQVNTAAGGECKGVERVRCRCADKQQMTSSWFISYWVENFSGTEASKEIFENILIWKLSMGFIWHSTQKSELPSFQFESSNWNVP